MAISSAAAALGGAVIGGVGSMIGGSTAASGAKDAAATSAAASDRAAQVQQDMYDQTRTDFTPYRGIGDVANPYLQQYVLGGQVQPQGTQGTVQAQTQNAFTPSMTYDQYVAQNYAPTQGVVQPGDSGFVPSSANNWGMTSPGTGDFDTVQNGGLTQTSVPNATPEAERRAAYDAWVTGQTPQQSYQPQQVTGQTGMSPDIARSQGFVNQMGQMNPNINADLDPSRQAMQSLGAMNPNVSVDYNAIVNDPMYQFALEQAQTGQNRNLAQQGMLQSRAGGDALADTGMRVALNERDRIYGQNVDNYNRAYGQGTDQYNMQNALATQQYGVDTGNYNRGYGQLQDQASLSNQLGSQQYNRLMGLSNIGQNAAGQMAANNQNLASGLSSSYMNQGNALAQGQLAQGQIQGSMWANAGNALGYGLNQYNQQQQPAPSNYTAPASNFSNFSLGSY